MTISDLLLPEFNKEMEKTRTILERVNLTFSDWKPHEKSMSLGKLASHLADLPQWASDIIMLDFLDVKPDYKPFHAQTEKELLEAFDSKVSTSRKAIAEATDEHLQHTWTFSFGGKPVLTQPRYELLRGFVMDHLIHHRGQLSVYLRLNNIPVPGMYGPSADEK